MQVCKVGIVMILLMSRIFRLHLAGLFASYTSDDEDERNRLVADGGLGPRGGGG